MTKSQLFTQYNRARAAARKGLLDPKRVNKALGLAQLKTPRPYKTTINSCNCKDRINRPTVKCSHMIKEMIEYRAAHVTIQVKEIITPAQPEPETIWMTGSNGDTYTAEQVSGGYYIHSWWIASQAQDYVTSHPAICWVRPTSATGRRQRPDEVHSIGG